MDYRNADGSIGEMCGNGIRVLGRYLPRRRRVRDRPVRGRDPGRGQGRCTSRGRRSPSTWARRGCWARPRRSTGTRRRRPARRHGQPARGRLVEDLGRRRRAAEPPDVRRGASPTASTSSSSYAAASTTSRCGCTSAARARPARAAPAPARVVAARRRARGDAAASTCPAGPRVTLDEDDRVLMTGPAVLVAGATHRAREATQPTRH